jgi:hypothetical protein
LNWTEIVGGVAGDTLEVVSEARISSMRLQQADQLIPANPTGGGGVMRDQIGDRLAAARDHDALSGFDLSQQAGGVVTQLS